mmetsp:Transcript_54578/g.128932  ORF Transcript_54578/g.128932 Transcript_54578/m.128932 type:complete len:102 (-) Transcript_54578:218-523(-)
MSRCHLRHNLFGSCPRSCPRKLHELGTPSGLMRRARAERDIRSKQLNYSTDPQDHHHQPQPSSSIIKHNDYSYSHHLNPHFKRHKPTSKQQNIHSTRQTIH